MDMIVAERLRLVWGFWDIPIDNVRELCRSCGATAPGVLAQRYNKWTLHSDCVQVMHPSLCFVMGPANIKGQDTKAALMLPLWLDPQAGESGVGAHEFEAKDLPTWDADEYEVESNSLQKDIHKWPHLGNVKLFTQKGEFQKEGVHQLHVSVTDPSRRGGRGARDRQKQKSQRDRQKHGGGYYGSARWSSAVADSDRGKAFADAPWRPQRT